MNDSNPKNERGSGRSSNPRSGGGRKKTAGGGGKAGKGGGPRGGKGGRGGKPRDPDDTVGNLSGPLERVLKRLPATQREVLEWRMGLKDGHPTPIGETAKHLGLTLHEAKEIEQRAFEHIREVVPLDRLQKLLKG